MTRQTSRWAAVLQPLSALLRPFRSAGFSPAFTVPVHLDLAALDDPQAWQGSHPELSAALPGPGEVIPVTEGESALWLQLPDVPGDARGSVWLGLGDAAGYVLTRHEDPGLPGLAFRAHLLRYPREAITAEFERRAPAWIQGGQAGRYGTWSADGTIDRDWQVFTTRGALLDACRASAADPGRDRFSHATHEPGLFVVAHAPDTGWALWSDGHLSEHLQSADRHPEVTAACLTLLERISRPQRLDLLAQLGQLLSWEYVSSRAASPARDVAAADDWGHLTLEWRHRTERLPVRQFSPEWRLSAYEFPYRPGETPVASFSAEGSSPGRPVRVQLDDSMILPEYRTPEMTPEFLWPHSVTDLHLVLSWMQRLDMHLIAPPFAATVLPATVAQLLVDAYGAQLVPEDPAAPLIVVDTYQHWEGGYAHFCEHTFGACLDDAALAAELERRGLARNGLGTLFLRHAAADESIRDLDRPVLVAFFKHWEARLAVEGDTFTHWVDYFQEEPTYDPGSFLDAAGTS